MVSVDFKLATKLALLTTTCLLVMGVTDADADARRRSDADIQKGDAVRSAPSGVSSKGIKPTAVRRSSVSKVNTAGVLLKIATSKLSAKEQTPQKPLNMQNIMFVHNDTTPILFATPHHETDQEEPLPESDLTPTPSLGSKIQSLAANNLRPLANLFMNSPTTTVMGRPLRPHRRPITATSAASFFTSTVTAYSITTVGQVVFKPTFVTQVLTIKSTFTSYVIVPVVSTSTNVIVTVSYSKYVVPIFSTTTIFIPRTIRL